ncbi:MAG TPA: hypothetical protein DCF63_19015 [Planctomycetaceae bacterium]|nr:hypothetical protein [Planctomycetaceae bacterium]
MNFEHNCFCLAVVYKRIQKSQGCNVESKESIVDLPEDVASAWAAVVINIWEKKEQQQRNEGLTPGSDDTQVVLPEVDDAE